MIDVAAALCVLRQCADASAPLRPSFKAFTLASLPVHGVGLARLEFIISRIGLHPQACLEYEQLPASDDKARMREMTLGAASPAEFYVHRIAEGVATIAAAFYPTPVIVRLSDFKTNEVRVFSLPLRCLRAAAAG